LFLIFNRWLCRFVFDILISVGKGGNYGKCGRICRYQKKEILIKKKEILIKELPETHINLVLTGNNQHVALFIEYKSVKYKDLEEKARK